MARARLTHQQPFINSTSNNFPPLPGYPTWPFVLLISVACPALDNAICGRFPSADCCNESPAFLPQAPQPLDISTFIALVCQSSFWPADQLGGLLHHRMQNPHANANAAEALGSLMQKYA